MKRNKASEAIPVDFLLCKIRRSGWSERLANRFEKQYGRKLRWLIVVHMEKLGLLQSRLSPERIHLLSTRRLELFENTLSDLWLQLVESLIDDYLEGVDSRKVHQEFLPYLSGVIRHFVIANARSLGLLGRETPAQIIHSICEAKQDKTYHARVAWAKFCFEHRIRLDILHCCPSTWFNRVYRNIHRVADYFFERFIPAQCEQLAKLRSKILESLVESFASSESNFEEAIEFIGTVTPFSSGGEVIFQSSSEVSDDE